MFQVAFFGDALNRWLYYTIVSAGFVHQDIGQFINSMAVLLCCAPGKFCNIDRCVCVCVCVIWWRWLLQSSRRKSDTFDWYWCTAVAGLSRVEWYTYFIDYGTQTCGALWQIISTGELGGFGVGVVTNFLCLKQGRFTWHLFGCICTHLPCTSQGIFEFINFGS